MIGNKEYKVFKANIYICKKWEEYFYHQDRNIFFYLFFAYSLHSLSRTGSNMLFILYKIFIITIFIYNFFYSDYIIKSTTYKKL